MLTLFSIPKPFTGHDAVIQRNAIGSWTRMRPGCEVILLGDEAGVAQAAEEFGVRHIPGVARNDYGTPLLSSAFRLAEESATRPVLGYVNADIILAGDFPAVVARVPFRKFLMVGRRWDLDVEGDLDFDRPDADERLVREARTRGALHPPSGSDYFVFPRGTLGDFPPFAVGRPRWDNWFIYSARARRWPVIDATACAFVVHQNHGYGHVKHGTGTAWMGPEADRNLSLAGGWDRVFVLDDATHVLTADGLECATADAYLRQRIDRYPARTLFERGRHRMMELLFSRRRILPDSLRRRLIYALSEWVPKPAAGS